ncbi:MAG: glycosyltransferase [Anaerolineales bacterium]|nr:glycosyltransferase [Anaerolineales bacterium]
MRVLHINDTSHTGGAARAMRRLHHALVLKGHESQFLVGRSIKPDDPLVHLIWDEVAPYRSLENSLKSRIGNQFEKFLGIHPWANRTNLRITDIPLYHWADIIDLRNLFGGFFNLWSLPALSAHKPVVWRLPDLWATTGHCAYPYDCQRWKTGCFDCPLLSREGRLRVEPNPTIWDGSRRVWRSKKAIYEDSQIHIIVTTKWMRDQVKQSILGNALSVNIISNGVDLNIYKPRPKAEARTKLGLPTEGQIVLWAAGSRGNYRKGYHLVVNALESIQESSGNTPMLITMGDANGWSGNETLHRIKHSGYIQDSDQQALLFAAADVFLCSTLADAQPQTALESLACGTPIIAFDIGPMPDLVIDGKTGYLVPDATVAGLYEGINRFLQDEESLPRMGEYCRQEALEKFDLNKQTEKYINLYQGILAERRHASID